MITSKVSTEVRPRLEALLGRGVERARQLGKPVLASLTLALNSADAAPIAAFANAREVEGRRGLWAKPSDGIWMVGAGDAAFVSGRGPSRFQSARAGHRQLLEDALVEGDGASVVLLGGFSFDTGSFIRWDGFPDALLVLHRVLLTWQGGAVAATINTIVGGEGDAEADSREAIAVLERLLEQAAAPSTGPSEIDIQTEDPGQWFQRVQEALGLIESGDLQKVVLARQTVLVGEKEFPPEPALEYLADQYPECVLFAFDNGDTCFLGATPEPLVRLADAEVSLSCLAGTVARGDDAEAERDLLFDSPKERAEHAAVVDMIARTLKDRCADLTWDATPEVARLHNVAHLRTNFTGQANPGTGVLDLVEALHPTPAVGGVPTEESLALINTLEGGRGWYAGPVGWVDETGSGEFNVAIRSALLRGRQALLFAGAGIVKGSVPMKELAETDSKFQPMLWALGAGAVKPPTC